MVIPEAGVDLRPASFLVMSLIVTFICFILNITTLIFGIPAIIMSVLVSVSLNHIKYLNYVNVTYAHA